LDNFVKYLLFITFILLLTPGVVFAATDTDNDGLADDQEAYYYTDPNNADTDGDRFSDGLEVANDYSPHAGAGKRLHEFDFDKDGLNDWAERWFETDIGFLDTDNDGAGDFAEVMRGVSPTSLATTTIFSREIIVDLTVQQLYVAVDGIKIIRYPVSTGNPGTPTPAGEFKIERMRPFVDYIGADYSYPRTPWNLQFKPRYYLHAATWHNDFGIRTRSHGCVNMRPADAKELYEFMEVGVPVTVTGTTPSRYYVGT